ncbi:MAG: molybdopterin-dependent oxidoreductase [Deinococcaceae bacterium]
MESEIHGNHIVHASPEGVLALETPLTELRKSAITPTEQVFVYSPHDVPKVSELLDGHLGVIGQVHFPVLLEVSKIRPDHHLEMVLQCFGNGQGLTETEGIPWQRGGVANVQFSGMWLRDLVNPDWVLPTATHLIARGHGPDLYEKSIPLEVAWETAFLATHMNEKYLPRIHGGPLRLIVPGYFSEASLPWLSTLYFSDQPSPNNEGVQAMPIKSIIWEPLDKSRVTSPVRISGAAWNGGSGPIERIELSLDHGKTWHLAQREDAEVEPSLYAWTRWHLDVDLPFGRHEVWSRASDHASTQPSRLDVSGSWNAIDTITFEVFYGE